VTRKLGSELVNYAARIYQDELGDPGSAAEAYARILRESPDDALRLVAARKLDRLYAELGRSNERCAALESLGLLESEPGVRRQALEAAADLALQGLGDVARAVRHFRALLAQVPADPAIHEKLVSALRAAGDQRELAQALSTRSSLGLSGARADLCEAAGLYAELGDLPAARRCWLELRERFGHDDESLEALASILERLAEFGELAQLLGDAAEKSAQPARLYARQARILGEQGDRPAALAAHIKAGELERALEMIEAEPALLPEDGHSRSAGVLHFELGKLLHRRGKSEAALKRLELAAELLPASAEVLAELASVALAQGELARAERSLRALLLALRQPGKRVVLTRAEVYLDLSDVLLRQERAEEAENYVTSAFDEALESELEAFGLEAGLRRRNRRDLLERALRLRVRRKQAPFERASAVVELFELCGAQPGDAELRAVLGQTASGLSQELGDRTPNSEELALARRFARICSDAKETEPALELLRKLCSACKAPEKAALERELIALLATLPAGRSEACSRLLELVLAGHADAADTALLVNLLEESGELKGAITRVSAELEVAKSSGDAARVQNLRLTLGLMYERSDLLPEALRVFRMAALRPARRSEALHAIKRVLERLGGAPGELADVLEQLSLLPGAAPRVDQLEQLVELRRQHGDAAARERALKIATKLFPARSDFSSELLSLCSERGDWAGCVAVLEGLIAATPDNSQLRLELARHLRRAGRLDDALVTLQGLAGAVPGPTLQRELYQAHNERGQHAQALSAMEQAARLDPKLTPELLTAIESAPPVDTPEELVLRFAELCVKRREGERALTYLARVIAAVSPSPLLLSSAARLAAAQGQTDNAIRWLAAAVSAASAEEQVKLVGELWSACSSAGRPELALPELERVCAQNPAARRELWPVLRGALSQTGQLAREAELVLARANEETAGERHKLLVEVAQLFERAGAHERALEASREVMAADAEHVESRLTAARALQALQRGEEALELLQAFVSGGARNKARFKPVHRLLAEIHFARDEIAEALPDLAHAYQLDRNDLGLAYLLGVTALDLDEQDQAMAALRMVVAAVERQAAGGNALSSAELARAYYYLAEFEHGKSHTTAARRLVGRALDYDANFTPAKRLSLELS
jgi:tetratricopeptide (TPR) repeat protein